MGEKDGVLVVKGAVCEMGKCVTNHVQKLSLSLHDVEGGAEHSWAEIEMGKCVTNHVQKLSLSLHDVRG